jgi:hypothetical protein
LGKNKLKINQNQSTISKAFNGIPGHSTSSNIQQHPSTMGHARTMSCTWPRGTDRNCEKEIMLTGRRIVEGSVFYDNLAGLVESKDFVRIIHI